MNGEIQPNASVANEICTRSDKEAVEVDNCICCLLWNDKYQWRLYIKIDCKIITDSELKQNEFQNITWIQTDKPIQINTSLLSPKNQKRLVLIFLYFLLIQ